uniref:Tc1-like transposase DDE domain-containing protein n=1 Tax=Anguilla anguilla TaxID=7936 RepID=A0A0E9XM22_ANGAN
MYHASLSGSLTDESGFGKMLSALSSSELCGNSLGEGRFLFQHGNAPLHKVRSLKKWLAGFGGEELDWPAQSLPRRVEAVTTAKVYPTPYQCPWFWNEMFNKYIRV